MTDTKPELIHLRDGEVVLYRRSGSNRWQARLKIAGDWRRISTKEQDAEKAGAAACRVYDEARFRRDHNMPAFPKSFKDVAELEIAAMERLPEKKRRKAHTDYIAALRKYHIPYFGHTDIDRITEDELEKFDAFRERKLGRVPKKSTLANHNAAMRRVFAHAVRKRWMSAMSVPPIEAEGEEGVERPWFSEEEVNAIEQLMPEWIEEARAKARNPKTLPIRQHLFPYVMILSETGMRPGTETRSLRWCDIKPFRDAKGELRFEFHIRRGKTGARTLVANEAVKLWIEELLELFETQRPSIYAPVFALPDGHVPRDLHGAFENFLQWAEMLHDEEGQRRSLYSLRHYYATQQLLKGTDMHLLARQMGTSVAMIEKYYSKLEPRMKAAQLAGVPLPAREGVPSLFMEWFRGKEPHPFLNE